MTFQLPHAFRVQHAGRIGRPPIVKTGLIAPGREPQLHPSACATSPLRRSVLVTSSQAERSKPTHHAHIACILGQGFLGPNGFLLVYRGKISRESNPCRAAHNPTPQLGFSVARVNAASPAEPIQPPDTHAPSIKAALPKTARFRNNHAMASSAPNSAERAAESAACRPAWHWSRPF